MVGRTFPVRELVSRLEDAYGRPAPRPPCEPTAELVACILSQHTTDATSFTAFERLKATFPTWDSIADASPEAVAVPIRHAGLANQKSKSIVACLNEIRRLTGSYSLAFLRDMEPLEARGWLTSLPGVGPKTASI